MNPIMMANMQAIINQTPRMPKVEKAKKIKLMNGSKSKKIIEYLFEHGKSSGEKIIKALDLNNSPKAYIQPHIITGRVVCDSVHIHKAMYQINTELTRKDFGLRD
jgi:hypothetical protein